LNFFSSLEKQSPRLKTGAGFVFPSPFPIQHSMFDVLSSFVLHPPSVPLLSQSWLRPQPKGSRFTVKKKNSFSNDPECIFRISSSSNREP
jgi:hypothetical protein